MSNDYFDPTSGLYFVNETDLPAETVATAAVEQHPQLTQIASALSQNFGQRQGSIFQRDKYVTPDQIAEQIRLASHAAKYDDVIAGVLETTESMAFNRVTFECSDQKQQEAWNQIAEDINLDGLLRSMWREMFTVSQMYCAVWNTRRTFQLEGIAEKRRSRKEFNLIAPSAVTILDPLKVVPVGNFALGAETLAYLADRDEASKFDDELAGSNSSDLVVRNLFTGRYEPDRKEKRLLGDLGFTNTNNMFILNPDVVSRHTDTRATYERFADIRMTSVFELLDLKNLLRAMDRSVLLGGTNYIVLVRIGTDEKPAKQAEVAAMSGRVQQGSRLPVLIGDHRLQVDIVSPDSDDTLRPERYNTLDSRITARMYSLMASGGYEAGKSGDKSIELTRIMGRVMESRRHMLRRYIERTIIDPTFERNEELTVRPKLRFAPKRIALTLDPAVMTALLDLRDRREISRATMLGEFELSQPDEARKLQLEAEQYDEIFQTHVPHDSRTGGRTQGGDRNGGGRPPGREDSDPGARTRVDDDED